jgi:hypothetical protein
MNPYETNHLPSEKAQAKSPVSIRSQSLRSGRPCPYCKSLTTHKDGFLHTRPSVLYVIFIGWLSLLFRAAFTRRIDRCEDCGETNSYYSMGSRLALVFLVIIVLLIILELWVLE